MMDRLVRIEIAPEVLLHHEDVLEHVAVVARRPGVVQSVQHHVAVLCTSAAALPMPVQNAAAIAALVTSLRPELLLFATRAQVA
jgi:hypothetical protein